MSSSRIEEARARAQAIVTRVETDDEFRQRLKADPEETLRAEGMPDDEISEFAREAGLGEVEGYRFCPLTCIMTGCQLTSCSRTSI
jgi:hypothetical protein